MTDSEATNDCDDYEDDDRIASQEQAAQVEVKLAVAQGKADYEQQDLLSSDLAEWYNSVGDAEKADNFLQQQLNAIEQLDGKTARYADVLIHQALVKMQQRKTKEAVQKLNQCIQIEDTLKVPVHHGYLPLAKVFLAVGDANTAEPILLKCMEEVEAAMGDKAIELCDVLPTLAMVRLRKNRTDPRAKAMFDRTLGIATHHFGPDSIEVATALSAMVPWYQATADVEGAINICRRAVDICSTLKHPMLISALQALTSGLITAGRKSEAIVMLLKHKDALEKECGAEHPAVRAVDALYKATMVAKQPPPMPQPSRTSQAPVSTAPVAVASSYKGRDTGLNAIITPAPRTDPAPAPGPAPAKTKTSPPKGLYGAATSDESTDNDSDDSYLKPSALRPSDPLAGLKLEIRIGGKVVSPIEEKSEPKDSDEDDDDLDDEDEDEDDEPPGLVPAAAPVTTSRNPAPAPLDTAPVRNADGSVPPRAPTPKGPRKAPDPLKDPVRGASPTPVSAPAPAKPVVITKAVSPTLPAKPMSPKAQTKPMSPLKSAVKGAPKRPTPVASPVRDTTSASSSDDEDERSSGPLLHTNIAHWQDLTLDNFETLDNLLRRRIKQRKIFPTDLVMNWFTQICEAVKFAAARGVVHRDIKPHNIFIDSRHHVKVAGFGSTASEAALGSRACSVHYLAPELLTGGASSSAGDIFALGVLLHRLLSLDYPFRGNTFDEVAQAVRGAAPAAIPDRDPPVARRVKKLLAGMLSKDAASRPGINTVVSTLLNNDPDDEDEENELPPQLESLREKYLRAQAEKLAQVNHQQRVTYIYVEDDDV